MSRSVIVTVTPNPSLDRTLEVTSFERGAVLRAASTRVEAGGKGINVARALHANGHAVRAVLPCGGFEGDHLIGLLAEAGIPTAVIPIRGAIRANISVVEPDGTVTKINEPGPDLDGAELARLVRHSAELAARAAWVVCSGSLPPGAPIDLFAQLTVQARAAGARVAVDTSGPALAAALDAGPDLVKPNVAELTEVSRRAIRTLADAIDAAEALHALGARAVLASLGGDGAILVDTAGVLHAEQAVTAPRNSVGAGDAALAGCIAAGPDDRVAAIRSAVAFGAAAVSLPGSQMPGPGDLAPHLVAVTDHPDLQRVLAPSSAELGAGATT